MYCKTIILSNSKNLSNSPKGILTLSNDIITKGKIRLYNSPNLPPNTKIGLYVDENVYLCNLTKKPQHYEFMLDNKLDISKAIYCAIIDNSKGDKQVLLEGGSFNGFYFTDTPLDAVIEAKDDDIEEIINNAITEADKCTDCNNCANCEYKKYFYESQSITQNNSTSTESNLKTTKQITQQTEQDSQNNELTDTPVDCAIDENITSTTCTTNENETTVSYTENKENEINTSSIYNTEIEPSISSNKNDENAQIDNTSAEVSSITQNNTLKSKTNNINKIDLNTTENDKTITEQQSFLNEIVSQLDEMFKIYPQDDLLNSIIPESRFIKVDNADQSYVLGIIYEDKMMKYLAYGVPATYNSIPPADLGNNYQWLPLNPEDVMSDGYFMIYQNVLTGNIVDLTIE